jgi:hypothetical protein
LAKLTKAAPQASLQPRYVGDGDVMPSRNAAASRSGDSSHDTAYKQLMALAEEQRKKFPFKTAAQAFADVYQDKANIELANRERYEARRRGSNAYPGWPT